ncbi:hypothetical protein H7F15_02995 [Pontibacter sp. Tf4]|uniref:hypothetical protein n=1 Tax=Pontibacter sp. Tf4 TaxID=2761620 RepID=UPI0016269651|nr:hypothetical protein [Pontibacter sp. Tf4]MBB6609993.1 hypothetical protein [Pontibacter sp. Tf4]
MKRKQVFLFSMALSMLLLTSCVSVPRATVTLSGELSQMIVHSRQSHLQLLDQYTAMRKAEVDRFLEEEYIPAFTGRFVRESGVLHNIQAANTDEAKGAEILEFAVAALPVIYQERAVMMQAVDEMDKLIRTSIEAHYQQMLQTNQALTAYLGSAADVVQTREELQRQLRVNVDTLIPLDKMNKVMEKMLQAGAKAEDIPVLLEDFKEKLNEVKDGKTK